MRVFIWVSFNIIESVLFVNDQTSLYLAHLIVSLLASLIRSDYFYKQCPCPRSNQCYFVYLCIFFCHSHISEIISAQLVLAGSVLVTFLSCFSLNPESSWCPENLMSFSLAKGVLFPLFYMARISTDLKSYLLWTQGQQFISSIGLMQVKFRNILLRCIARRHASHKCKHIQCSDILTRHVCSCTCICICSDTVLVFTTQTWFPSRFGDNQNWLSNKIVCVSLIDI